MNNISHQITISSVDYSLDIGCVLNIKKRLEKVVYRSVSNRDNINIAYVSGKEITPATNLVISNRGTSLNQNRIVNNQQITVDTVSSFKIGTDKFLITNKFSEETPTQPKLPLFYKHQLVNYTGDTGETLISLSFLDENYQEINNDEYLFESSTGLLYNNIENNIENDVLSLRYIKYTVKVVSGPTETTSVYHELINNIPIFRYYTYEDIDEYGNLEVDANAYITDQLPGSEYFNIILPTNSLYAWKETPASRITISLPEAVDIYFPWFVKISNGSFLASLKDTTSSNKIYKYYIPEFGNQSFNPYPPYKKKVDQRGSVLTKTLIKTLSNISSNSSFYVDIVIKDLDDEVVAAYSNNPLLENTEYINDITITNNIASIDYKNGFIELTEEIDTDYKVYITYYTEEDQYEFVNINFNPTNNIDIVNKRIVIYTIPETTETGTLDRTIYYLVVDQLNRIVYCSQADENSSGTDPITLKLLNKDFNVDGTPKHTFYYDKTSTEAGLLSNIESGVNISDAQYFSFIDKYTVESILFSSLEIPTNPIKYLNFTQNPKILVLGDIFVDNNQSVSDIQFFDLRVRGGGIKEDYVEAAIAENPEVNLHWDLATTKYFPSAGAFLVQLPQSILETYGGNFSLEQVKDIVARHISFGNYPIIKFYGINPAIINSATTTTTITISWPSYGSTRTYNIYYSKNIETEYVLANNTVITDNLTTNTYTLTGLKPNTKYYIKIEADDESFSQIISATTLTANN